MVADADLVDLGRAYLELVAGEAVDPAQADQDRGGSLIVPTPTRSSLHPPSPRMTTTVPTSLEVQLMSSTRLAGCDGGSGVGSAAAAAAGCGGGQLRHRLGRRRRGLGGSRHRRQTGRVA